MSKYIAIDIGHGEDTWTVHHSKGIKKNGVDYEEHHSNAETGIIVEARLRELGFKTIMGQTPYKNDVQLATRTNLYNKEGVDLSISIHSNSATPQANGTGVFYWHTSNEGKKFAELVMKHYGQTVKGVGVYGKGVIPSVPHTWSDFHMCRVPHCPAVLCEFGFMTNDNDFEYVFGKNKKAFHEQCAETIVKAVCEYFGVAYKEHSEPIKVPTPPQMNNGDYKVQENETFWSIAKKLGVDVAEIQRLNPEVKPRQLKAGMYLKLPKVESGVVVVETPKAPKYELPTGVFKKGSKGEAVKQIQVALNALKFNCGKEDGVYGDKTVDAIKRFQKVYDAYQVDGVYGSRVQTKMNQLLNK